MQFLEAKKYIESVAEDAPRKDFFAFLRTLEALAKDKPRIGYSFSLRDDLVEFKQPAHLEFASSTVTSIKPLPERKNGGALAVLETYFFGLSGPNGALPYAMTDYIVSRKNGLTHPDRLVEGRRDTTLNRRDTSLFDFLNIFNHRFLSYYYRSWASSRKTVDYDRPEEAKFAGFLGAFSGVKSEASSARTQLHNYFSGYFSNQSRHPEGLAKMLSDYLGCAVSIEENVGHWIVSDASEQFSLGQLGSTSAPTLGEGIVLGSKIWDRQLRFDINIGPVSFERFEQFAPTGVESDSELVKQIKYIVSKYTDRIYFCVANIFLDRGCVPSSCLGENQIRLGMNSWLKNEEHVDHAKDLSITIT